MFEYETLKIIWAVLILVLTLGFTIAEGMVMGSLASLIFFFKNEQEKRVIINTIGMHWEGNQVWLVLAGGAMFAAWPIFYASSFSTLNVVLYLVLGSLFLRPTGIDYRSKVDPKWKKWWDVALIISGTITPLVIGVGVANIFTGLPFTFTKDLNSVFTGNILNFFSPMSLLFGVIGVCIFILQGLSWLYIRADESMSAKLLKLLNTFKVLVMVGVSICFFWVSQILGYEIQTIKDVNSQVLITDKLVNLTQGGWLHNFTNYPMLWALPALVLILGSVSLFFKKEWVNFLLVSLLNLFIVITLAFLMAPFIWTSSTDPSLSLTMWDAVSSKTTLQNMLVVALVFVPIVLSYTLWCYYKMWGRIKIADIDKSHIIY